MDFHTLDTRTKARESTWKTRFSEPTTRYRSPSFPTTVALGGGDRAVGCDEAGVSGHAGGARPASRSRPSIWNVESAISRQSVEEELASWGFPGQESIKSCIKLPWRVDDDFE